MRVLVLTSICIQIPSIVSNLNIQSDVPEKKNDEENDRVEIWTIFFLLVGRGKNFRG